MGMLSPRKQPPTHDCTSVVMFFTATDPLLSLGRVLVLVLCDWELEFDWALEPLTALSKLIWLGDGLIGGSLSVAVLGAVELLFLGGLLREAESVLRLLRSAGSTSFFAWSLATFRREMASSVIVLGLGGMSGEMSMRSTKYILRSQDSVGDIVVGLVTVAVIM